MATKSKSKIGAGLAKRKAYVRRRTLEIVRANPQVTHEQLKEMLAAESIGNWGVRQAFRDAVAKVGREKNRASLRPSPLLPSPLHAAIEQSNGEAANEDVLQRLVDLEWEMEFVKDKLKKLIGRER